MAKFGSPGGGSSSGGVLGEGAPWGVGRGTDPRIAPVRPVARDSTLDSALGVHCRIKGSLEFGGKVRIDGTIEGQIAVDGELTIGEQGVVNGQITARSAFVLGRVTGDISCTERIELHAGATVTGDIQAPRVVIQDGVAYEGRCRMATQPDALVNE